MDTCPSSSTEGLQRRASTPLERGTGSVQNQPRGPFRWVGWNGDPGHGWGHHLHLSYMHSATSFGNPARVVYTRKCPEGRIRPKRNRSSAEIESARGVSAAEVEAKVAPVVPERR